MSLSSHNCNILCLFLSLIFLIKPILEMHRTFELPRGYRKWKQIMNSMKLVVPYILLHKKRLPNDAVTPQCQSQFMPKMKANVVPRLLSSLVRIDQYNQCNGMTIFMEFMRYSNVTKDCFGMKCH